VPSSLGCSGGSHTVPARALDDAWEIIVAVCGRALGGQSLAPAALSEIEAKALAARTARVSTG